MATNYDGLIISALVEAQAPAVANGRRKAGPCPLRGMRSAQVAHGEGARLAAAVSLVLASAKVRDHVIDRDGMLARKPMALAARRTAARWDRAGATTGADLGFDTAVLVAAVERQPRIEQSCGPGTSLLAVTEPTESATAAAFGHTAVLAGRPRNQEPLEEAGRLFGRLAHLLDAVEDLAEDSRTGAWNPLIATGVDRQQARRLCDDAVHGVKLALADVEFTDHLLVHALLVHELRRSVDRAFGATSRTCPNPGHRAEALSQPYSPTHDPGIGSPPPPPEPPRRQWGLLAGCVVWAGLCVTCQLCCREHFDDPWSGKRREGLCHKCDCDCDCSCCDCGDCGCGDCDCCGCDCCDCSC